MSTGAAPLAGARDAPVLVIISAANRRGAELEALELGAHLTEHGLPAHTVALSPGTRALPDVPVLGESPVAPSTLRALRRAALDRSVVLAFGSRSLPACALALAGTSTPFVYRSIGDPARWVRGPIHRRRTGVLFRRADRVVALWDRARQDLERLYRVDPERLCTIPNARDPGHFTPPDEVSRNAARADFGLPRDVPIVATLGALTSEKQVARAIDAMRLLPDAHLAIAGDGPEREQLAELATEAGNATMLGAVSDPRRLLQAADALLLTSRTEGMPGVIIEAGLTGVPTVAPDVGAIGEMIADGQSGVLVAADASAAVTAAAVRTALQQRQDFGTRARQQMEASFTWDRVVPMWLAVLETTMHRSPSSPQPR